MKRMMTAAIALTLAAGAVPDLAAAQRWRQDDGPPPREGRPERGQGQQEQTSSDDGERHGGGRHRGEGGPPSAPTPPPQLAETAAPPPPPPPPPPAVTEGRWTARIGNATSGPGAQDDNRRGDEQARQGRGGGDWRGRDRATGPMNPPQTEVPRGPGSGRGDGDWRGRAGPPGGEVGRFQGGPPQTDVPRGPGRGDGDWRGRAGSPGGDVGRFQGGPPQGDDRRRNDNDDRRGGRWDNGDRGRWDGGRGQWNGRPGYDRGDHRMRDRDRGRNWFDQRRWRPEYRSDHRYRIAPYRYPRGWFSRLWVFGDVLPYGWYNDSYYLDWRYYGLPVPPIGCEWVRVGQDALLVDVWSGEVLSVYRYLFW